jgi:sulfur carrier protein ThiS
MRVSALLSKLDLVPGTVMVIRGAALLIDEDLIQEDDEIEIRSVISGGV